MIILQLDLATRYLGCLDRIEPGLTRNRGKTTFELVDVKLHLLQVQGLPASFHFDETRNEANADITKDYIGAVLDILSAPFSDRLSLKV